MSVKDRLSKRVTFNAVDDLEQKVDRLTVMMGKLGTEDEGQSNPFKPQVYQPNRGRNQIRMIEVQAMVDLGQDQE